MISNCLSKASVKCTLRRYVLQTQGIKGWLSAMLEGTLPRSGAGPIGAVLAPRQGSKYHPLTDTDKAYNRMLSGYRIVIENILCYLKVFRILSEKYRNRRKRYGLRFNLIAALYNRELDLKADL